MRGQGAIVFIAVFLILLLATLAFSAIPPGEMLYERLGVPKTDYPVLGIPATILVIAVFNGVIYGVIIWLVSTFVRKLK
ncbi:MAG: hypothetical protein QXL57_01260 [Candidatus Bathyarchaeia archaeon]